MRQIVASLLLLSAACKKPPPVAAGPSNPYREAARSILEDRCGKCHRADSPDANPRSLAVFTLNDLDFAAKMNRQELSDMLGRFTGEISSNEEVTPAETATMRKFVDAELLRR